MGKVVKLPPKVEIRYSTRTADGNDLREWVEVREGDDPAWRDIAVMTKKLAAIHQEDGKEEFDFRYREFDIDAFLATDNSSQNYWIIYVYKVDPEDDLEEPDRMVLDHHAEFLVDWLGQAD